MARSRTVLLLRHSIGQRKEQGHPDLRSGEGETLLIDKRGCRESRDILQSTTAFIIFAFNTDAKSPKKIIIFLWLIYIYSQAICFKALTIG